ncbi:hypothetical protein [Paraglaciecola sp. 20A4]|nr:hypothetical protein [Paraglaciecola sp. 20A4]
MHVNVLNFLEENKLMSTGKDKKKPQSTLKEKRRKRKDKQK